jgi:hypothetical protein
LRALGQPLVEALGGERNGIGRGDAQEIEAQRQGALIKPLAQAGLQKSRSA